MTALSQIFQAPGGGQLQLCQALLELTPDMVYIKDRDGRYVMTNSRHARFMGLKNPSEIVGKTVFDFFPQSFAQKYHQDDMRVLHSGHETGQQQEACVDRNGKAIAMLRLKMPLRDADGGIVGLVGVARVLRVAVAKPETANACDTPHQTGLSASEPTAPSGSRQLDLLPFALNRSAKIITLDAQRRISDVNDAFCQISGYTRQELVGQRCEALGFGLTAEDFRSIDERLNHESFWHGELRHLAKDGSACWLDTTIVARVDQRDSCDAPGYALIMKDVTQHVLTEEALRLRTKELEAAVQSAERSNKELRFQKFALDQHAIVAATDARGRITYVNDQFCQISKYKREELIGQDHRIVNSGYHPKAFFKQMYATIAAGNVWHGEIRNRAKDGSLYWVETTIVPIRDETSEQITGYVAIRADITARKLMEENLRLAKEAAEAASHAKGEFMANMSHEIRTPMTAVIGYADLLSHGDRTPEERMEFVQIIRRNGEHLLTIINDLLDLSKVEAGKLNVEAIAMSPVTIAQEVESLMRVRAAAKGIGFCLQLAGNLPKRIHSDPTRVRQVLLNLVSNAVKFTQKGGVRISVWWDADLRAVRFDVMDTGIGLSEEQQRQIFRPFAQADSSTTRRFGGTGLGLALSQRLAELLGGRINLISRRGEGSTFSFLVLDRSKDDAASTDDALQASPTIRNAASEPVGPQRLSGRLLLVEDGADNRRLVTIYLHDAGLSVDHAENGQDALEMVNRATAQGQPYDVILMDMQMPVMDGYQTTAELRRRGVRATPIIAFTAHAMDSERQKCLAAGCDDFATKPVDPDSLIQKIGDQLRRPRSGAAQRPPAADGSNHSVSAPAVAASCAKVVSQMANHTAVQRVLPEYIAELPRHVAVMNGLLGESRLTDLRRLAHQLKGSGGGYGFPDISKLAAVVERAIDSHLAPLEIQGAVDDLCQYIRRVDGYEAAKEMAA